jgi:hypothetical protein
MDLREHQRPLKQRYRDEPDAARITLAARGSETDAPVGCNVDLGRALFAAEAHSGVGGPGTGACSGDLLLGALAACAQITWQAASGRTNRRYAGMRMPAAAPGERSGNNSRLVPLGLLALGQRGRQLGGNRTSARRRRIPAGEGRDSAWLSGLCLAKAWDGVGTRFSRYAACLSSSRVIM